MNYKIIDIVWNTEQYIKQHIIIELPKNLIISSCILDEFVHHNIVQTKQALGNFLRSMYGFEVISYAVEMI